MLTLYYHPLASYCWKVLIALYEHGTPFERCVVDLGDADQRAALLALWPLGKFPVVRDGDRVVAESSIIIEYLDRRHAGPRPLVPADGDAALEARRWDRIFDSHVQTPVQEIVFDRLRGAHGDLERAYATLTTVYALIEQQLGASRWIAGDEFGFADCAAAPALFYATTLRPFPDDGARLRAYFERLVARPSVQRTLEEARPYFEHYPFASAIATRFR
jgi:glutathione S-transferase